jgi:ABC-2 type transport system permease protein
MSAVELSPSSTSTGPERLAEPARRPHAGLSLRFLRSEMQIIMGRRRNKAGLAVLAVVPLIIAIAVKVSNPGGDNDGPDYISAILGNGLFVAIAALLLELPLFLPLAVATLAGDAVAGEANIGTLRYLLTIPAGRARLLGVKFVALVISAFIGVLTVALVGTIAGLALFGGGKMTLLSGTQISLGAGVWRVVLIMAYLTVMLSALAAIGLFVSTLTEQPIAATTAIVLINVMMFILDSISQLAWLHPWLLTHWFTSIDGLLRDPIYTADITRGLLTALVYAVTFWLAAWARFSGKDITS